mgnify:CR=1 FL=1
MYHVKIIEGRGISLGTGRSGPTVEAVVVHDDGAIAWRTDILFKTSPRTASGLRLQASNAIKRLNAYFAENNERWEHVKQRERETKKRRGRIAQLERLIPKLQTELTELLKEQQI